MSRSLLIGNCQLTVNFDSLYYLRDFYYPYVGSENQSKGHFFRLGIWVDGEFSWVHDSDWDRNLDYLPETLVTSVLLENKRLQISLLCNDAVDVEDNLYLKRITIENKSDKDRRVRLFFTQDFHIGEHEIGDTGYYNPDLKVLVHYKGKRYFLVGASCGEQSGFDQYALGLKEVSQFEGTWRDAEDGQLSGSPIAQGSVDSVVAFHMDMKAHQQAVIYYWIAAGPDLSEVEKLNTLALENHDHLLASTEQFWRFWVNQTKIDFMDLPQLLVELFKRSLLILHLHIDKRGGIIAGLDHDIVKFGRDHYAYIWPRDGSFCAHALDMAGYPAITKKFFNFCQGIMEGQGYFWHKYNADGSRGSSWHAWISDGEKRLPIQEDETALVLWALDRHFSLHGDIEDLLPLYHNMVIPAANFLLEYRDKQTGLPLPSYDLWEERYGVHAFTCAAVYAGLMAAADLAAAFGEKDFQQELTRAAQEVKEAVEEYFWDAERRVFRRTLYFSKTRGTEIDLTPDISLCGLFYFGLFSPADPRIVRTLQALQQGLAVRSGTGGYARYEGDSYQQIVQDITVAPGNPWIISTLGLASWHIETATNPGELKPALELLEWVARHALPARLLPEQLHPDSGGPVSVCPLAWSHAAFVSSVMAYLKKKKDFEKLSTWEKLFY